MAGAACPSAALSAPERGDLRGLEATDIQTRPARPGSPVVATGPPVGDTDELGMIHVHLAWEPHVGTPIVNRAEAEAARLRRAAKQRGDAEPFERHLADAYAALLAGNGKGRARRPELVVLVSHEVAARGWNDVRQGEFSQDPRGSARLPQRSPRRSPGMRL